MNKIERLAGCVLVATICVLPVLGEGRTRENEGGTPTEELRSLMTAALATARTGDQAKLEEIARNLMIPNYEAWFKATFGEEQGTKLTAAYKTDFDRQEKWIPKLFESLSKQEGEILVEDAREPRFAGGGAWCGRVVLLRAAKKDAAFYRVSLQQLLQSGLSRLDQAGYFTLVEGAYRRLDCKTLGLQEKTEVLGGVNRAEESSELPGNTSRPMPTRIRVAGNVLAAAIITRVQPIYPEEARRERISGSVRLRIIVGKDGRVVQTEVVSGHPLLQQAAIEAVRQWRYKTTMLNEQSVEVDSTVDMIFSLPPTRATSP